MSTPPQGEGWRPGDPHGSGPPWQQGPWLHPPGPPPPTGNGLKWLLGAVAVLLVIAIAVGITVIVMSRGGDSGPSASPTGSASDIASANDTGPVALVVAEPICQTFMGINDNLATIEGKGWNARRNSLESVQEWTQDDRTQMEAVATAMANAADQMVALAQQTPHRIVRELYSQSLLYGRLYADSAATYTPKDYALADVFVNGSSAIAGICNTIDNGAASRSIALDPADAPSQEPEVGDPSKPVRFIAETEAVCAAWIERESEFIRDTTDWATLDASIPATEWSPQQTERQLAILPTLNAYANAIETAGRGSANPIVEDFPQPLRYISTHTSLRCPISRTLTAGSFILHSG